MNAISVMGSTGTIGANTLAIVDAYPGKYRVVALAAGSNLPLVREQIRKYGPKVVSVLREPDAQVLAKEFPQLEVGWGEAGACRCATDAAVDTVVMGIVGFAALAPTLAAVREGKRVALANKESLVVAGPLLKAEARRSGSQVIPVDSEHNALFQLLEGRPREHVATLVLTASGGPLLRRPEIPLADVTPELAVAHPNWKMGPKISVDSASLMNKGLELIESCFLFDVPESKVEVWVHPQSILHGAVWLTDNSVLAQLSRPDMRSSIGYALAYPERLPNLIPRMTFKEMASLEFFAPDLQRFPALGLARDAMNSGGTHLVALNAANEVAVDSFLNRRLLFSQITDVVSETLSKTPRQALESLEHIWESDRAARALATELVQGRLPR